MPILKRERTQKNNPTHPRLRPNGGREFLLVGHVDEIEFQPHARHHLREQAIRAAVDVVAANDMIAGAENLDDRRGGAQTGGECEAVLAAVQLGQTRFEYGARWVAAAAVFVELLRCGGIGYVRIRTIYSKKN